MELNKYHKLAMRTDYPVSEHGGLRKIQGVMGLNGEAGEAIEVVKKEVFQGHPDDDNRLLEELGDCLWYIVQTADAIGKTLEEVAQYNIDKLKVRFPDGFTPEASIERKDHDPDGKSVLQGMRDES